MKIIYKRLKKKKKYHSVRANTWSSATLYNGCIMF